MRWRRTSPERIVTPFASYAVAAIVALGRLGGIGLRGYTGGVAYYRNRPRIEAFEFASETRVVKR